MPRWMERLYRLQSERVHVPAQGSVDFESWLPLDAIDTDGILPPPHQAPRVQTDVEGSYLRLQRQQKHRYLSGNSVDASTLLGRLVAQQANRVYVTVGKVR